MTGEGSDAASWRTRVRAILLHPRQPWALVLRAPDGVAVPQFDLPGRPWPGKPREFVRAVRDRLGLDVTLLRTVDQRADSDQRILRTTLVFAVRDAAAPVPVDAHWLGPHEPACPGDVAAVLGDVAGGRSPAGRVPWRDRAWLGTAEEWIATSLAALGTPVTGPVDQVRMAELSCVLRAPTDRGPVYFKATTRSPLFVDEGPVMAVLADLFPGQVPAPLAVDAGRHWMLLPDFGPEIGWEAPVDVREDVVREFARLQIRSAGFLDRALGAGCFDRTPPWLARQATEWLVTVDLSRWVSSGEAAALAAAGPVLARACAELAEVPVPTVIGHGDMHLGNVARGADGYLFFDWTDACVMHPFVDMITIFAESDVAIRECLRDAYLDEWGSFAPRDELARAWRLAEPLAVLNQVVSYHSIAAHLEPGTDCDGLAEETGTWLRRLIDWCGQPALPAA